MPGKHHLGAVGKFVRERYPDGCPKIIARLVEDAPGQIQRTITGLPLFRENSTVTGGAIFYVSCGQFYFNRGDSGR